ncbi:MAG: hypothetical protein KatS3mg103_0491 [Phycisphaerales bacterium]|nr:MAG: hypothetical protein KatS3mg103_0491 [Phycisphaerales bacterium]
MRMTGADAFRLHRLAGESAGCPHEVVASNCDWVHGRLRLRADRPDFHKPRSLPWPTIAFVRDR